MDIAVPPLFKGSREQRKYLSPHLKITGINTNTDSFILPGPALILVITDRDFPR